MGLHHSEHCYYFMVIVVYGLLCQCDGQDNSELPGDKLPPAQTTTTKMTQPQQPEDNNDQDSSGQSLECGGNWQHNSDTKKCYSLQEATNSISWNEAENKCIQAGGHLACPSTDSQHNAVVEIIRQRNVFEQNVWIGLMHETGAGGQNRRDGWKWVDDSPYNFKHWVTNEPGENEKVVRLQDGMWKGIGSDEMYQYFLCEKEPTKIPRPNNPQHGGTTEPIFKDTPGAGENDSRVTAKSAGNDNRKEVPVLGLALGVTFGVAIIALVAAVMFMRTRRSEQFNSMLNHLKIGPSPKKRSDDQYCDIKDEDLDRPHIYHNEIANQGYRVDRQSSSDDASVSPVQAQENRQGINGHQTASYEEVADEHQYTPLQRKN